MIELSSKRFSRASAPHGPSLGAALQPLFPNMGVNVSYDVDVVISVADWTGVDLNSVQSAVNSAPDDSSRMRTKDAADSIPDVLKAAMLVLLDAINIERAQHSRPAITAAQFINQVKAKIDTLP
jgi:hypothetical protein